MSSTGPAIRAVCRITSGNSCGSGSICGHYQGGSLVLTNAHVVGTEIGKRVSVQVESIGAIRTGRIIRAAYSSRVSADWALVHVEGLTEVKPVYLTRALPKEGESLYTKGFPRCQPHDGTDIEQFATLNNGVLLWEPNSIGGQSGSGVWGDSDHLQKALLTWSINYRGRWRGAGQLTAEIWAQNRAYELTGGLRGAPRMPIEYVELAEGVEVEEGIFSEPLERGIQDYPIWIEDVQPEQPEDPDVPSTPDHRGYLASLSRIEKQVQAEIARYTSEGSTVEDPDQPGGTFGL